MKSPLRTTVLGASPSAWRAAIFSTSVRLIQRRQQIIQLRRTRPALLQFLLFRGAFTQKLGNVEVHEISMMENDRFDRALHLVAFVAVRGDNMQNFAGNAVLVSQRDAAEGMAHLLPEFSLDNFARRVLVVLQRFTNIRQQRPRNKIIALDG